MTYDIIMLGRVWRFIEIIMLKLYGSRASESEVLDFLSEFKVRVFTNYPIKGRTRKNRRTKLYRVTNFPV